MKKFIAFHTSPVIAIVEFEFCLTFSVFSSRKQVDKNQCMALIADINIFIVMKMHRAEKTEEAPSMFLSPCSILSIGTSGFFGGGLFTVHPDNTSRKRVLRIVRNFKKCLLYNSKQNKTTISFHDSYLQR